MKIVILLLTPIILTGLDVVAGDDAPTSNLIQSNSTPQVAVPATNSATNVSGLSGITNRPATNPPALTNAPAQKKHAIPSAPTGLHIQLG